jgi:hypothetical protein
MTEFINKLPDDIISHIKEYTLSPDIRIKLFYQNNNVNSDILKKILKPFSSKQLEEINWKYLYYKVYKTSPPKVSNDNLLPIFDVVPKVPLTKMHNSDEYYEPPKLYNEPLCNTGLMYIIRSNYYSENVRTEIGRKRQQYKNIIGSWVAINQRPKSTNIPELDYYLSTIEFELIKAIYLLSPKNPKNQKIKNKNK